MIDSNLLIDTVTIARPDRSTPAANPAYSQVAAGVACRLENLGGQIDPRTLGRFSTGSFRVYFNSPVDVEVHDRLTDQNSVEYMVQDVDSLYGYHTEARVERRPH